MTIVSFKLGVVHVLQRPLSQIESNNSVSVPTRLTNRAARSRSRWPAGASPAPFPRLSAESTASFFGLVRFGSA